MGNLRQRVHLEDLVAGRKAMLKVNLKEIGWEAELLKIATNGQFFF